MKKFVGVLSLLVAICSLSWSFGSGELTSSAAITALAAWCGLVWSCIED
jgi:hypothetical protein